MVKRLLYALTMLGLVLAQPSSAKATTAEPISCGGDASGPYCWWYNPQWDCIDQGTLWRNLCNPAATPLCGNNGWPD